MTDLRLMLGTLAALGEVPDRRPRDPDELLAEHEEPDPDLATTGDGFDDPLRQGA